LLAKTNVGRDRDGVGEPLEPNATRRREIPAGAALLLEESETMAFARGEHVFEGSTEELVSAGGRDTEEAQARAVRPDDALSFHDEERVGQRIEDAGV
jgi:hypothetical protein